jgi:hypothetical protein
MPAALISPVSLSFVDSRANGIQLRRGHTFQDREVKTMTVMARNVVLSAAAAALCAGAACSSASAPVDIGDSWTGQKLEDYAAHWEGYAEAHDFADGSDKVKLTLDASGNGTLEIGDSAPLPVATNPNVGYPASFGGRLDFEQFSTLFPGFAYTIGTATVESARIRFSLNPWQIERDWCALQTSYDSQSGGSGGGSGDWGFGGTGGSGGIPPGYAVGPDSGGYGLGRYQCLPKQDRNVACAYSSVSGPVAVDCAKGELCWQQVCACDAQHCTFYEPPVGALATRGRLDAALDDGGKSLVGTLKIGNAGQVSVTVRLKRMSNN